MNKRSLGTEDYWVTTEELNSSQMAKCEYLFRISRTKIFKEFSKWVAMPRLDKARNSNDFIWYLSTKYEGRE